MADYLDSATVRVAITPSGVDLREVVDSATVYIDITPSAIEKHFFPDFTGEGLAYNRFTTFEAFYRFEADANERFTARLRAGINA